MTKRETTEKWVGEFNAIPQGMIAKLWQANIDDMHEVTKPRVGDVVWSNTQQDTGEIVHIYDTGEPEADVRFGDEVETFSLDDISVERDDGLPMWGTMWSFGDRCDEYWLEEEDGIQVMSDHGFRIYEHEEFGYFFGIDGAGYNFYDQHWVPLYDEEGKIYDIVAGTFIICGLSEDNFASLPSEVLEQYKEQFHQPEVFAKVNGKITAMKAEPEKPSLRDTLKQHAERSKAEFGDQPSKPEKTQDAEL